MYNHGRISWEFPFRFETKYSIFKRPRCKFGSSYRNIYAFVYFLLLYHLILLAGKKIHVTLKGGDLEPA